MQASDIVRSIKLEELIRSETSGCLAAFAATLKQAPDTSIEAFLETRPGDRDHLVGLIGIELRRDWERGHGQSIESYLKRFPELAGNREHVLDLIYAEYCERKAHEPQLDSGDFYQRFPDYRDSLERLFRIDSLFGGESLGVDRDQLLEFPDVGDEFLTFRLVGELGRGAFGRVFLAEQTDLSDRRVVIKITPLRTIEHQTLARLEHPHIVPVHSVHRDELSGLQAVCMPYQCAVALSDIHATWRSTGQVPRSGDVFVRAARALIPAALQKSEEGAGIRFPAADSYVRACAWIMHKLALALHHAHLRGIYHRDLKPSNVLLTASGRPLLVDFNLAFNRQDTDCDSRAFFGGTLPYMPPEQIQVLHPEERGRADDVGPRSDIYSLAATIHELLTGQLPFGTPPPGTERMAALSAQLDLRFDRQPSARAANPLVPSDLDAVLRKCLDAAPYKRYETAGELADDLDRFLRDYPLRHIGPVPARIALWKFARRNRRRLLVASFSAATFAAVAGIVQMTQNIAERERVARTQAELSAKASELQAEAERERREATEVDLDVARSNTRIEVDNDKKQLAADGKVYFRKGVNYFSRRLHLHAILIFNDAEELGYRSDHYLYFYRGRCHARFDEDQEALRDFNRAIELNPEFAYSYMSRAVFYATAKNLADPERAIADVQQALELWPSDDEGTSSFLVEAARVYARVWHTYPQDRSLSIDKDEALRRAEQHLFDSIEMGFAVESIRRANQVDRFRMLDGLLERDKVKEFLAQYEGSNLLPKP